MFLGKHHNYVVNKYGPAMSLYLHITIRSVQLQTQVPTLQCKKCSEYCQFIDRSRVLIDGGVAHQVNLSKHIL